MKVITVLTAVQKVKKNVTVKSSCWNEKLPIAAVFIAKVITGRSSKVITVFTIVQKVMKNIVKG